MYSYRPRHMAKQKQDDQLELTYSSYVKKQDVTLKTCRRWWMIGRSGQRWSGISVLTAHDDDDDDIKLERPTKLDIDAYKNYIYLHFYLITFYMTRYRGLIFIHLIKQKYYESKTPSNYLSNQFLLKPVRKLYALYTWYTFTSSLYITQIAAF